MNTSATRQKFTLTAAALCAALLLTGATDARAQQNASYDEAEISDPLESYNRAMTSVNEALDKIFLEPGARFYRFAVPSPARTGVRNILRTLRTPVNVANQALQGDVEGVAHDVTRFVINTLVGVGGLIDVAEYMGLKYEQEDFGQTLATWGLGHGSYFVLPLLGPSSLRDATGLLVDTFADPVRIYLHNTDNEAWQYVRMGATALDTREQVLDAIDDLRRNSFDYYAALRSAYAQKRAALVRDANVDDAPEASIPDYDQ